MALAGKPDVVGAESLRHPARHHACWQPGTSVSLTGTATGFALVTGGAPEADLDGDGLTCEVNTVDVTSAVWTTIAFDNGEAVPPCEVKCDCPDGFTGGKGLCCKFVPPGSKLGRLICIPGPQSPPKK
jgi:hypothetical protein